MTTQTQTPSLSTLVKAFDCKYEELPAKKFNTTRAYHDFANDLIAVGISFRVKIIKKTKRKPSCIMVMLLREVDMTKPDTPPLEPHDHSQSSEDMPGTDSVDIIGACPSCGVLMANSEWCAYCGEDTAKLYSKESRDESRH
jgi:hypothetical protein